MIYKTRGIPKKLLGLTAFSKRLQSTHKLKIRVQNEFNNVRAGYGGEKHFDKHMLEFLPSYPHAILNDIKLKQDGIYFQMDSLLITPAAVFIFEVKNIGGKLIFIGNPSRLIRVSPNGETKSMQSPIAELERKKHFLQKWLIKKGFHIPIKYAAVLAYNNEIELIDTPSDQVTFAYQISTYLHSHPLGSGPLDKQEIQDLARQINSNHQEFDPFPMIHKWNVSSNDIQIGVQCLSCHTFGMQWYEKRWNCPVCGARGLNNHVTAVKDWFYLIDKKMTNRQFRKFIIIEDQHVAKRLLKKSELKLIGKQKGSYYVLK